MAEIRSFRTQTLQLFLAMLEGRSSWATLISVLRILIGQAAAQLSLPSTGTYSFNTVPVLGDQKLFWSQSSRI